MQNVEEICHFQFLNWPDHGIPPTTTGLLKFYKAACLAQPTNSGPMLVHCRYNYTNSALETLKRNLVVCY